MTFLAGSAVGLTIGVGVVMWLLRGVVSSAIGRGLHW
jgi:hypothetical protein